TLIFRIVIAAAAGGSFREFGRHSSLFEEAILMKKQPTTIGQLAQTVGGRLEGDPKLEITGAAILADVTAGEITLVDHVDRIKRLNSTQASAAVVSENVATNLAEAGATAARCAVVVVTDVH